MPLPLVIDAQSLFNFIVKKNDDLKKSVTGIGYVIKDAENKVANYLQGYEKTFDTIQKINVLSSLKIKDRDEAIKNLESRQKVVTEETILLEQYTKLINSLSPELKKNAFGKSNISTKQIINDKVHLSYLKEISKEIENLNSLQEEQIEQTARLKKEYNDAQGFIAKTGFKMSFIWDKMRGNPVFAGGVFSAKTLGLATIAPILAQFQQIMNQIQELNNETGNFSQSLVKRFTQFQEFNTSAVTPLIENFSTFVKLQREFGVNIGVPSDVIESITNYKNIVGLTADESVALLKTMKSINGESIQFNDRFIKSLIILSDKNNVSFKDVMGDLTSNADYFAQYMSKSESALRMMLLYTRSMGVEFGLISKMLGQFESVETTLEKQFKLSMFMGQNFDFLGVAQRQQDGDGFGAMKMMMNQLKNISEQQFNTPFLKKQIADTFGISVSELNTLYSKVKNNDISLELEYVKNLENFNKNFSGLGINQAKDTFKREVILPFSNYLAGNTEQVQGFFNLIDKGIKLLGWISGGFLNIAKVIDSTMGKGFGTLALALAPLAVVGKAMLTAVYGSYMELKQIKNLVAIQVGQQTGGRFENWARNNGMKNMGTKSSRGMRLGMGGLGLLTSGLGAGIGGDSLLGSILTYGGLGLQTGAIMGNPIAMIAGTILGAITGGVLHGVNNMNQGGILVNSPTRIGNTILGDGQNGTQKEAVIPLSSDKGKSLMEIGLSDDSIKKLAKEMSKILKFNFTIHNHLKNDKDKEVFEYYANPTNGLAYSS